MKPHNQILCILFGGKSGEHEVSLRSAASVIRHAPWEKEQMVLIGITREGHWQLQDNDQIDTIRQGGELRLEKGHEVLGIPSKGLAWLDGSKVRPLPVDVVFPVLHGTFGEDGTMQGWLEILDLPYVGSGVLGSALGMDKEKVKHVWKEAGLPVVDFRVYRRSAWSAQAAGPAWDELVKVFGSTLFVKPCRCGSSVGISRVVDLEGFRKAMDHAFAFDTKVMVEPAVDAREIEVSVVGNDHARSFVPGEIAPKHHEFYDYDAKYLDPDGAALLIPSPLGPELSARVKQLAEQAYTSCEARGFSRVDFFLDRKSGELMLNEINTLPGFTSISMFPRMCEAGGLLYPALIEELCNLALEEYRDRQSTRFTTN